MQQFVFALFNGLASGMVIFLVAAGVTLIFGILRIVNFSHGAFFMLGAYAAFAIVGDSISTIWGLIGLSLLVGAILAIVGYVVDVLVLRRISQIDEHFVLIGTFALMLLVNGLIKLWWGLDYYFVAPPDALNSAWRIGGVVLPTYSLFIIVVGAVLFVLLDLFLHKMWVGKLLRSVVADRWMVGILGYNVNLLYSVTVMLAFALAGLAGTLLLPNQSLSPILGEQFLLLGFVCCIIGGLGNVRGAFIAAIMLGVVENLSSALLNLTPGILVYIAMAAALLLRPQGIFAPRATNEMASGTAIPPLAPRAPLALPAALSPDQMIASKPDRHWLLTAVVVVLFVVAALVPLFASSAGVFIVGLTMIEALFALCWFFLFQYAGVVSFGHAAFFAIGAYGVGYLLKTMAWMPFLVILAVVAALAGGIALIVGLIALRRASGIYLAILTMALAEIFHLLVTSSTALGRDDGLPAIPRPSIDFGLFKLSLVSNTAYYYFILTTVLVCGALLWRIAHGPFGRTLLSVREDNVRSAFLGIDVAGYQRRSFVISGAVAAVAGGLYAPWTQIVTPEVTGLMHSVQPMLNSLLGGTGSFFGPILGASVFSYIEYATRTMPGAAEAIIGAILLFIVLVAPEGLAGFLKLAGRFGRKRPARAQAAEVQQGEG